MNDDNWMKLKILRNNFSFSITYSIKSIKQNPVSDSDGLSHYTTTKVCWLSVLKLNALLNSMKITSQTVKNN